MIRLVTFEEYEPKFIKDLCTKLFASFGVGAEYAGVVSGPGGSAPLDARALLKMKLQVQAFSDDKILTLTSRAFAPRKLSSGEAPTFGLAEYGGQRAVVSVAHIKNPPEQFERVARHVLQEVGHTWGLQHCLDPRCAMYAPWTLSFGEGDASFCTFCREVSEERIRLAKS